MFAIRRKFMPFCRETSKIQAVLSRYVEKSSGAGNELDSLGSECAGGASGACCCRSIEITSSVDTGGAAGLDTFGLGSMLRIVLFFFFKKLAVY
jgi:hypothetical protein